MKKTLLHVFLYLLFLIPSKTFATPVMPQISSGGNEYWYQIVFQRYDASLVLQDNGDDVILTAQTISTADATKQLWKVEESNGNYIISSKGGRKLYWDDTSRFKAGTTGTEMKLIATTNTTYPDSYELQRNGGTNGLNPFGGSVAGKEIGETTMADGGNCVRFVPQGLAPYITLSAGGTEYWYNIEFTNNRNVWLKDAGEDAKLKLERLVIGSDDFFWKVEAGATFGQYVITSKNGRKLYWDGTAGRYKSATSGTAVAVEFITAGSHLWRIRRPGSGTNMNGSSGAAVGNEVNEYNDYGGNLRFVKTPFKVSDNTNTYWYRVSDSRATTYYWYNGTYSSNPNSLMVSQLGSLPKNVYHSYFKFVKNSTGNGYLIYSAAQPTTAFARKDGYLQADGATGEPMFISSTSNTSLYNSKYIIQRESNQKQYNSFTGEGFKVWEYDDLGDAGNQWKFEEITLSDATIKTNYTDLRTAARKLYNYSAAGTYFGKFPAADRATFLAVIAAEEAKNADNLSSSQHIEGYNALFNAIATYKTKVITDVATITSTTAAPKWFYISSNATNTNPTYAMAKVMTSNGVTAAGQAFKFETKANTDAQYWRFEAVTGGVRIINKASSGYEFGDPNSVAAGSGTTYIPAIYANDGFSITLAKSENNPLHAQQSGSVIVKWPASDGGASLWVLQAKDENLTNGTAVVPVVSTLTTPVYYYIFSAYDGTKPRINSNTSVPNDTRSYCLLSPNTSNDVRLTWGTPTGDNALWAIVDVGDGTKKLYNKGTGKYMTASWNQNATGDALTYTAYASPYQLQYRLNAGNISFALAYANNTIDRASDLGFSSQTAWYFVAPTFTGTGDISTTNNWSNASVPASQVAVIIDGDATVNADANYNNITINSGKSLSVAPGKVLTINGTFTLKSDATSGTATVTGNVSGNATVEQYLPAGTERTWWYLASPVTGAAWTVFGSNQVGSYSEATRSYSQPFEKAETLEAGRGYVVKMNASEAATYQFANKALNNGNISVPLTRSVTGTLDNKRGFNLVGNPYPSYLNWEMAYNASTNVRSTIWYRTKGTSAMEFHTYNAALGVSVPTAASGYIPPMQAFWVKVDTDPVSPATESTGTLNFTNAMRGHANSSENRLKAPAASTLPILRLELSNGTSSDETVIALHETASANFDQYDSEKMSNTGTSEVFTLAGTQELTINALPYSESSKLIPLGIRPASTGSLSLSVSELKNLDNMQVILHDNVLKTETQLSLNESYNFTTDGTATNNRFSIEFRAPGMTTGLDNSDFTDFNITVYSGKIQIQSPAMANGELIRVYSSNGQKIMEQTAEGNNTIIDHKLRSGVYFVKVSNYVQKIIIH